MPFVKADLDREKAELDRLINESKEARKLPFNRNWSRCVKRKT